MFGGVRNDIVSVLLLAFLLMFFAEARSSDVATCKAIASSPEGSEMSMRRSPRSLSRREIFEAIQNDLAQKGISGRGNLRPGDLEIQCSVPVLQPDMGLQVKRVGFDPIRRTTVFELWTSGEPQYLPFEVTARRDPRSWGLNPPSGWDHGNAGGPSPAENSAAGQGAGRTRSQSPVLAKPRSPATLVMLGQNIRITTTVVPLQPGTKGQQILVRDLATARVMTATVVGKGLLEISF